MHKTFFMGFPSKVPFSTSGRKKWDKGSGRVTFSTTPGKVSCLQISKKKFQILAKNLGHILDFSFLSLNLASDFWLISVKNVTVRFFIFATIRYYNTMQCSGEPGADAVLYAC